MRPSPMMLTAALTTLIACSSPPDADDDDSASSAPVPCEILFGTPAADTGLGDDRCAPACACDDLEFTPPTYAAADVAALEAWVLTEPLPSLESDPYDSPDDHPQQPDLFCALHDDGDGRYHVQTHDTVASAEQADATITHHGACGLCSTLQDLAVYMAYPDLSGPVRDCAMLGLTGALVEVVDCLLELGFTEPCAQIWAYNSANTREQCLDVCLAALDEPYHLEDGSLNDCIQCDEDLSGPVFKAVSGRTRRNSGLPTALCRPCDSVAPVVHVYPVP